MITVVGADYSTRAIDLALIAGNEIHDRAKIDLREPPSEWLRRLIDELTNWRRFEHASALYLEGPWLREAKGVKTALALHKSCHFLEAAAIFAGIPTIEVSVFTWRSQIFGRNMPTAQAKRASVAYVKDVYGVTTSDDNLADAICIATYGAGQARIAALSPKGPQ